MTPQEKMQAKLEQIGIPYKKINCYGRQIVVTSHCEDTAKRWAGILGKFSKVKGVLKSRNETKVNTKDILTPSTVDVWMTYASIE